MNKLARKPSSDPVQEKLRTAKSVWNKEVSVFVNDLIHYKKLMNGWPNKFHMEKSMIKEPVPADPSTIIGSLVSDFNDIAQKGNALIKEQLDYSKTRKKKSPKPSPGTSPTPDLSQQLTASFERKESLIAQGSNPISRFFSKLLMPNFGTGEAARIRKYRRALLDSCAYVFKDLENLQVEIVKSSDDSIGNANKLLNKTWTHWMVVYRGYTTYKSNMPKEVEDAGGEIKPPDVKDQQILDSDKVVPDIIVEDKLPKSEKKEPVKNNDFESLAIVKAIIQDYKKVISTNRFPQDIKLFLDFNNFYTLFSMAQPDKKLMYADSIINSYNDIINQLNIKYNTNGVTLTQIADFINKKPIEIASSFEKESQDSIKKWIGKTRHQFSIFDKTSAYRLDVYKMAEDIRTSLNSVMNSLEKDMKIDELDPLILDINRGITSLRGLMRALHNAESNSDMSKMTDQENLSNRNI